MSLQVQDLYLNPERHETPHSLIIHCIFMDGTRNAMEAVSAVLARRKKRASEATRPSRILCAAEGLCACIWLPAWFTRVQVGVQFYRWGKSGLISPDLRGSLWSALSSEAHPSVVTCGLLGRARGWRVQTDTDMLPASSETIASIESRENRARGACLGSQACLGGASYSSTLTA